MTQTNLSNLLKSNEYKTKSGESGNLPDNYMALNAAPYSVSGRAFSHDLASLVHASISRKYGVSAPLRNAVGAVIADLLDNAAVSTQRYGYRSMATDSFTGMHVGHSAFVQSITFMEAQGLVEVIKGERYNPSRKPNTGIATRFRATKAFLEMALGYGCTPRSWTADFRYLPRLCSVSKPIVLRTGSTYHKGHKLPGKAMTFDRHLPHLQKMAQQVNEINAFVAGQELDLGKWRHHHFERIFGQGDQFEPYCWNKGGRLYSPGAISYQQAPSNERESFLINGESTVEVDIGSSFLTIFRQLTDVAFDIDADPYDIPGLRRFASKSWVVMTFGHDTFHSFWPKKVKDRYKAKYDEGASGDWGSGNLQKDHPYNETQQLMLAALPELSDWKNSTVRWGDLQYLESCAVFEAVHTLATKHGITGLPVHDSIRVPVWAKGLATATLSDAFNRHVGVRPVIKVK